jgi:hypothetical protein
MRNPTMSDGMMYLRFADGSLRGVSSTPQEETLQRVPTGAEEISREQYVVLAAQARQAIADRQAELRAADADRQEADYLAMTAVSLPDALARRLSGYRGGA